jgi:hypothetical protein
MRTTLVAMNMVRTVALESYAKESCDLGPTCDRTYSTFPVSNINQALDQDCYLMEYPRASIHAENGRLNVSIPCWYAAFA